MDGYAIVLGDDCMALYKDGELVTAATRLTFGDILEGCGVSCDIYEVDLDLYDDPTKLPKLFSSFDTEMTEKIGSH